MTGSYQSILSNPSSVRKRNYVTAAYAKWRGTYLVVLGLESAKLPQDRVEIDVLRLFQVGHGEPVRVYPGGVEIRRHLGLPKRDIFQTLKRR